MGGSAGMGTVVVIGAGVAGCAAAAAIRAAGGRVLVLEAEHHLGGVAARGEHATVCGLAPIDAAAPDLLEPDLVGAWLPYLASGRAHRQGRVWLWPTSSALLQGGLRRRLAELDVEVRLGCRVTGIGLGQPAGPRPSGAGYPPTIASLAVGGASGVDTITVSGVVDASGRGISAAFLGHAHQPPRFWPAHRSVLHLDAATEERLAGRAGRLQVLARAQQAAGGSAALALSRLSGQPGLWQLSLDVAPGSTAAEASSRAEAVAIALEGSVVACAVSLAERDGGRPAGGMSLAELFATTQRGLCWAAWPGEEHERDGVRWTWPERDRHGIPEQAVHLPDGPENLWLIGKGMAVEPAASAALRVTGTCLALGAAVGRSAGRIPQGS